MLIVPDTPWRPLIAKLGYPFGFLIVVIGRQQFYTENALTAVPPFMHAPSGEKPLKLLRLVAWLNLAQVANDS